MGMKHKILTGLFMLFVMAICAQALTINEGTEFTPSLSNVTYVVNTQFTCTNISVDTQCMNITGGLYAGSYCYSSPTNITYTFNDVTTAFSQEDCYSMLGGFIKTSNMLPIIVLVLLMGIILPIIFIIYSGKQDQALGYIAEQGTGIIPLVVGVGAMVIIIIMFMAFAAMVANTGCIP